MAASGGAQTPCDSCAAPCCRLYHVGIDAFDAHRITSALKIPMRDFVRLKSKRVPDHEFRIVLDGRARPEDRHYFCLALGKVPDPDPLYGERCVFLLDVGGAGRCGIYEHRPGVCRVYPTLDTNGVISTDGGGRYCPPGAWQPGTVDAPAFRERWAHHRLHRYLNQDLIDGWNEHVLSFREEACDEDFFRFVTKVYVELERSEPDLFAPRLVGVAPDTLRSVLDGALRRVGWRTDETARHKDAMLGWHPAPRFRLEPDERVSTESLLVLDPDEDIDPVGTEMARRMRLGLV